MAAALESGRYEPASRIDTTPLTVGAKRIEDKHPLGVIDMTTVLAKSSNVGMTKIALSLEREQLWSVLAQLGFGQLTESGFPGESAGLLVRHTHWSPVSVATLSYGYGVSVTPLQLAQAYAVIASGGLHRPVSFVREDHAPRADRVLSERSVQELTQMLEAVVTGEGTGVRAAVPGYRVAARRARRASHRPAVTPTTATSPCSRVSRLRAARDSSSSSSSTSPRAASTTAAMSQRPSSPRHGGCAAVARRRARHAARAAAHPRARAARGGGRAVRSTAMAQPSAATSLDMLSRASHPRQRRASRSAASAPTAAP
jgi:hypothetical protein